MTASGISLPAYGDVAARDDTITTERTRSRRYALLDCWRGVACLMVVVAHASEIAALKYVEGQVPITDLAGQCVVALGAFRAGVQIFFVISGYCISATVDGFGQRQKSVSQYFSRRFWRIYPPYWALFILMTVAVTVSELASSRGWIPGSLHITKSPLTLTGSQLLGNVTLTETWRHHLFGSEKKLFLTHAWTLCYEEQFYLIVGLCLMLFPRRFFPSIIGVTVVSLALLVATAFNAVDITGFGFDRLWLPFAIGVLVYYRLSYANQSDNRRIDRGLCVLAVVATIANILPWNWSELSYGVVRSLATSAVFALLLISLYRWDSRLLARRPFKLMAFVGRISYSLYLVHVPIVFVLVRILQKAGLRSDLQTLFVSIPLCLAISLPLAWVFFNLFERPFLHRKTLAAAPTTA